MVILEVIFQAGAVKFGSVGGLDTLSNISLRFCDSVKIIYSLII